MIPTIFDLKCCPICGGKSGFIYKAIIKGTQFMPWKGGECDAYFEDYGGSHGAYRCEDCGKIINTKKITLSPVE